MRKRGDNMTFCGLVGNSRMYMQKQPFVHVLQNRSSLSFTKFTGKYPRESLRFNKASSWRLVILLKRKLRFPVKFPKISRTSIL